MPYSRAISRVHYRVNGLVNDLDFDGRTKVATREEVSVCELTGKYLSQVRSE